MSTNSPGNLSEILSRAMQSRDAQNTTRPPQEAQLHRQNALTNIPRQVIHHQNPSPATNIQPTFVESDLSEKFQSSNLIKMQRENNLIKTFFSFSAVSDDSNSPASPDANSVSFWSDALRVILTTPAGRLLIDSLFEVSSKKISLVIGESNGYRVSQEVIYLMNLDSFNRYVAMKKKDFPEYRDIRSNLTYAAVVLFHELVHMWHNTFPFFKNMSDDILGKIMASGHFCNFFSAYHNLTPEQATSFGNAFWDLVTTTENVNGRTSKGRVWYSAMLDYLGDKLSNYFVPGGFSLTQDMVDDILTIRPPKLEDDTFLFLIEICQLPQDKAVRLTENEFRRQLGLPARTSYV